jgi:hypothetical protein
MHGDNHTVGWKNWRACLHSPDLANCMFRLAAVVSLVQKASRFLTSAASLLVRRSACLSRLHPFCRRPENETILAATVFCLAACPCARLPAGEPSCTGCMRSTSFGPPRSPCLRLL